MEAAMAVPAGVALIGVVAAAVLSWIVASSRARSKLETAIRESDGRARAAEAVADEARKQIDSLKDEAEKLRLKLQEEIAKEAAFEARAQELERSVEEQKRLLADAEKRLSDTFASLAAQALQFNNESFLTLAGERLDAVKAQTAAEFEKRERGIAQIVEPVRESLKKLDEELRAIEGDRRQAQGRLTEQLSRLGERTEKLVDALKTPSVRGRWGEIQLRRVVEIAGMVEYCDFYEQSGVATAEGLLRPDMRIRLPNEKTVVVDAKAPLQAYMEAIDTSNEEERAARLREHARQIRAHIEQLSSKAYWDACKPTPEFVVLFLPGEMFFSAALQHDSALIEDGATRKVILATPTTLIALLKAVAYGWRQERLAENAQRISSLAQDLHDRLATMVDHFGRLGGSLSGAVRAFNDAIGSFQSRVMPAARRFKELGVASKKEMEELAPVDNVPREVGAPAIETNGTAGK
jgi:DNA recombination protein RmuC